MGRDGWHYVGLWLTGHQSYIDARESALTARILKKHKAKMKLQKINK